MCFRTGCAVSVIFSSVLAVMKHYSRMAAWVIVPFQDNVISTCLSLAINKGRVTYKVSGRQNLISSNSNESVISPLAFLVAKFSLQHIQQLTVAFTG